jgi:hypothetical protein
VGSCTASKCFIVFSWTPARRSAQAAHLLVHQDEYVFPLLLQQRTVELAPAPAPSPFWKQELLKFLYHAVTSFRIGWPAKWARQLSPLRTALDSGFGHRNAR